MWFWVRRFNVDSRMNLDSLDERATMSHVGITLFINGHILAMCRQIGAWIAVPALFGIIAQAFDSRNFMKFPVSLERCHPTTHRSFWLPSSPIVGSFGAWSQVVVAILGKEQWSNTLLGYVGVPRVPSPSEVIARQIMLVLVVWQCQILVDETEVWSSLGTWICTNFFQATFETNGVADLTFAVSFCKLSTSFQNFRPCWLLFGSALLSESSPQIAEEFYKFADGLLGRRLGSLRARGCYSAVETCQVWDKKPGTQKLARNDVLARSCIYFNFCAIRFARDDPWTWTCTLTEL